VTERREEEERGEGEADAAAVGLHRRAKEGGRTRRGPPPPHLRALQPAPPSQLEEAAVAARPFASALADRARGAVVEARRSTRSPVPLRQLLVPLRALPCSASPDGSSAEEAPLRRRFETREEVEREEGELRRRPPAPAPAPADVAPLLRRAVKEDEAWRRRWWRRAGERRRSTRGCRARLLEREPEGGERRGSASSRPSTPDLRAGEGGGGRSNG
jgi:hypothetical protein